MPKEDTKEVNLADYLGHLSSAIVYARAKADYTSIQLAEVYSSHPLLKYISVPRFKLPSVTLDVPVVISSTEGEKSRESITNLIREKLIGKDGLLISQLKHADIKLEKEEKDELKGAIKKRIDEFQIVKKVKRGEQRAPVSVTHVVDELIKVVNQKLSVRLEQRKELEKMVSSIFCKVFEGREILRDVRKVLKEAITSIAKGAAPDQVDEIFDTIRDFIDDFQPLDETSSITEVFNRVIESILEKFRSYSFEISEEGEKQVSNTVLNLLESKILEQIEKTINCKIIRTLVEFKDKDTKEKKKCKPILDTMKTEIKKNISKLFAEEGLVEREILQKKVVVYVDDVIKKTVDCYYIQTPIKPDQYDRFVAGFKEKVNERLAQLLITPPPGIKVNVTIDEMKRAGESGVSMITQIHLTFREEGFEWNVGTDKKRTLNPE